MRSQSKVNSTACRNATEASFVRVSSPGPLTKYRFLRSACRELKRVPFIWTLCTGVSSRAAVTICSLHQTHRLPDPGAVEFIVLWPPADSQCGPALSRCRLCSARGRRDAQGGDLNVARPIGEPCAPGEFPLPSGEAGLILAEWYKRRVHFAGGSKAKNSRRASGEIRARLQSGAGRTDSDRWGRALLGTAPPVRLMASSTRAVSSAVPPSWFDPPRAERLDRSSR
jgi:hypothetical protein